MTEQAARWIAARVPGAKVSQDADRHWIVKSRCKGGERITLEDDERLYLEEDDRRDGSKVTLGFDGMVVSFTSALADARAAGILPGDDKGGENG